MKLDYTKLGFYRVATVSPILHLGKVAQNVKEIINHTQILAKINTGLVLFPELGLTGYTCEDLFHNQGFLNEVQQGLAELISKSKTLSPMIIVGFPWQAPDGRLFNCAGVIHQGKLLGVVPKIHLPNYGEFYEKRWFTSGKDVDFLTSINNQKVRVSSKQLFRHKDLTLGIEICEDLWSPIPPSCYLALGGANVICNLSASNELVAKSEYRLELIKQQSARLNCAYLYACASPWESTKDIVFCGENIIAENGSLLEKSGIMNFTPTVISADLDLEKLAHDRRQNTTFGSEVTTPLPITEINQKYGLPFIVRKFSPTPFIPADITKLHQRTQQILNIQATGLARRMLSIKNHKLVLGLSGGLDSTLALLVCLKACEKLNFSVKEIHALSMPGLGTTLRTKTQAKDLATAAGIIYKEISIIPAVTQHFKDIKHNPKHLDYVYENSQARERTQILFDYANEIKGFVVGTGDLSELALGWATYNGDHMSNYGVNASIPKTLVKFLVSEFANLTNNLALKTVLKQIVETKISPELLPATHKGMQDTEEVVGPYILNDFFLFHFLRNGYSQEKIYQLALLTFPTYAPVTIKKWRDNFFKRFYGQQFKRTCLPPGQVGSVSLSPRGDWRFPDELE